VACARWAAETRNARVRPASSWGFTRGWPVSRAQPNSTNPFGACDARGADLSVLMIDLDHLRVVNNNYGHLAGDLLIQAVGELLQEVVGDDGVASRQRGSI
jgi:GGDEF domain-containing protein